MPRPKALSEEQLLEALKLKHEESFSNRKLAEHFEVGKTTIWENVFAVHKRIRVYSKRPKYRRCSKCGILHNLKVQQATNTLGGLCLGCCVLKLKSQGNTSKQISDFMGVDLAIVNKYWTLNI